MRNIEVHLNSKEILKPSSPTPPHLKSHKLNFFEQFVPAYYIEVILFYNVNDGHRELSRLKQSLSRTLTEFPPLAGRLKDNVSVDCNDEGILYVEARVDGTLQDSLKEIDVKFLEQFLPCKKAPTERITEVVQAAIQITVFQCGGKVIGGCFSHKIVDTASIVCFLKTWAANFRGNDSVGDERIPLNFTTASSMFPPMNHILLRSDFIEWVTDETCIVKRFVFDASAIKALKAKAASELVPHPTRVQVVSAFIWKHALAAFDSVNSSSKKEEKQTSFITHTIDLRKPNLTPLSKSCIGSITLASVASCSWDEREKDIGAYVSKVNEAILKINEEHVNKFRGENALTTMIEGAIVFLYGRDGFYMCSSWCNLGLNDVDFGWGKPVWVSPWSGMPSPNQRNFIYLIDIKGGDAIEAWVVLEKEEMTALESDQEFLAIAIPVSGIYA